MAGLDGTLRRPTDPIVLGCPAPPRSRVQGRRILYVDDDESLRRLLTRRFQRAGATCHAAGTHDEAVAALLQEPRFELGILDFEMPDGHADRLVPRLRALRSDLPLIGTSGSDRAQDFAECGIARFLMKPWGLDALVRIADW